MPAGTAHLDITQGDDYSAVVSVVNADGSAADITGYSAKAQIRRDVADVARRVEVEITTGVVSPNINLTIPNTQTRALTAGPYVWDLQLTSPTGQITTVLAGVVVVTREVTRAA